MKTQTDTTRFVRMMLATMVVWTLAIALPAGATTRTPNVGDLNNANEP
ncbi:hypothetical protein MNBD_ACTINO02-2303, partial [hydrothermal vent metagenome]